MQSESSRVVCPEGGSGVVPLPRSVDTATSRLGVEPLQRPFQSLLVRDVAPLRTVGLSTAAPADSHPSVRLRGMVLVEPSTELQDCRCEHGLSPSSLLHARSAHGSLHPVTPAAECSLESGNRASSAASPDSTDARVRRRRERAEFARSTQRPRYHQAGIRSAWRIDQRIWSPSILGNSPAPAPSKAEFNGSRWQNASTHGRSGSSLNTNCRCSLPWQRIARRSLLIVSGRKLGESGTTGTGPTGTPDLPRVHGGLLDL